MFLESTAQLPHDVCRTRSGLYKLVAEMGAAYLCGISGISQATIENSAAYLQGWRDTISKDSKLVVLAAAQAQKAVNYIVGKEDTEGHGK